MHLYSLPQAPDTLTQHVHIDVFPTGISIIITTL